MRHPFTPTGCPVERSARLGGRRTRSGRTFLLLATTTTALLVGACGADGLEVTLGDASEPPAVAVEVTPGSVSVSADATGSGRDLIEPVTDAVMVLPDGWFEMWGYGTVLHVDGDEVTPHYVTASTCTAGESFDNELPVDHANDDGGVITVDLVGPTTDYRLRPLADGPACARPDDDTIVADSLLALDELFGVHYPFFDERGVDWAAELATISATTETDPGRFDQALSEFMITLSDGHTTLDGLDLDPDLSGFEIDGVATIGDLEVAVGAELDATLGRLEDIRTDPSGVVGWGALPGDTGTASAGATTGDIGYLLLAGFEGLGVGDEDAVAGRDALVEALDAAIADLDGRFDRLVVDVRFNGGGYEDLAVIAAGYFVGEPTPAYRKWPFGLPDPVAQTVEVVPQAARFDGDVVVLTSPLTASAAEVFTLAMVEVADAAVIGTPSFGEFSDAIDWTLPNGTELTLSMEVYTDLAGHGYEGVGVPVDVAVPFDQTLDAAIDHLRSLR